MFFDLLLFWKNVFWQNIFRQSECFLSFVTFRVNANWIQSLLWLSALRALNSHFSKSLEFVFILLHYKNHKKQTFSKSSRNSHFSGVCLHFTSLQKSERNKHSEVKTKNLESLYTLLTKQVITVLDRSQSPGYRNGNKKISIWQIS